MRSHFHSPSAGFSPARRHDTENRRGNVGGYAPTAGGSDQDQKMEGKISLLFFKKAFEVEATTKKPRNPTWADDSMIRKPRSLMIAGGNAHVPCTSGERPL